MVPEFREPWNGPWLFRMAARDGTVDEFLVGNWTAKRLEAFAGHTRNGHYKAKTEPSPVPGAQRSRRAFTGSHSDD